MKPTFLYPAAPAALVLSFFVVTIPAPANPASPAHPAWRQVEVAPPPHDRVQPLAHTAIGAVIEANGWQVPATGRELMNALDKLGDFVQLPVTFSAVALNSGLSHPRVVITMRPSSSAAQGRSLPVPSSGGWGGSGGGSSVLGSTAANKPYLEGRLFLAANTEPDEDGNPSIKTIEFISWNSRKQKFDFGVIEGMGVTPELKILDGTRCFSCHKNRGPILGVAPWSNTAHNDLIRNTAAPLFKFSPRLNMEGKEDSKLGLRDDIDGLRMLASSGPDVDAAVRRGSDVLRDRERFRLLVRTTDGRKALVMLLSAIASRDALDGLDQKLRIDLNALDLLAFMQAAHTANKALAPSTLADFSPAGPVARPVLTRGPNGAVNQVTKYDALRATGQHGLPSLHQPSNPKAFVRPPLPPLTNPSQLVSAVTLARAIGLSEDDRRFLATALGEAVTKMGTDAPSAGALAKAVFTGPGFADVLKDGVLPERDDFKDRFVRGLVAQVRNPRPTPDEFWHPRGKYATAPKFEALAAEPEPAAALPSHACAACHDFRTGQKAAAFSPIPMFEFDPLDPTARENWLKTATRKQKLDVLGRLLRRIDKDKDMPPEDSVEADLYRVKDATAINAVKEWLDVELKKLK